MRQSEPFHSQLDAQFGEYSVLAEKFIWFSSIFSGIVWCYLAYHMTRIISHAYFATYEKLPKVKQLEWNNRGFSSFHAIFATSTAGYLLLVSNIFKETAPYGPVVFRSSIFSQVNVGISLGYFLSDLAMVTWYFPSLGGLEIIMHHLMSSGSLVLVMYSGHGHYYVTMVLFSECTTPFVNMRWYILKSGMKGSTAYTINGLILLFVWLCARILLFVYFFLHLYWHHDEVAQVFPLGYYFLFTAPPTLALLNVVWFFKILGGVMQFFTKKSV